MWCQKTRTGPLQGFVKSVEKTFQTINTLHADCFGPLVATSDGYRHVSMVIDAFSKYCVLLPLKTVTADEANRIFQSITSLFGTPGRTIMDAGKNFINFINLEMSIIILHPMFIHQTSWKVYAYHYKPYARRNKSKLRMVESFVENST